MQAYLTGLAKEIGALVESALTVTVTHVVASGFGSAKYLVGCTGVVGEYC